MLMAGDTDEGAILRRVTRSIAGAGPLEDLLTAVCHELARHLRAPLSAVLRRAGSGAPVVAATGGAQPVLAARLADPRIAVPVRLEAPVRVDGREWGRIVVAWVEPGRIPPGSQALLADIAELLAIAVSSAEQRLRLIASRFRIVAAADDARRRLERDLHDGAQQRLVLLTLDLQAAEAAVPAEMSQLKAQLGRAADDLAQTVGDLQELARGIHPAVLSHGGLRPALKTLARRCPVPVHRQVDLNGRLPEAVEVALYYVASEALTNIAKHAGAEAAWLDLRLEEGSVVLEVRDDGVGGAGFGAGSGLDGLRDRIDALGGWLHLDSPSGAGTTLTAAIPLRHGTNR